MKWRVLNRLYLRGDFCGCSAVDLLAKRLELPKRCDAEQEQLDHPPDAAQEVQQAKHRLHHQLLTRQAVARNPRANLDPVRVQSMYVSYGGSVFLVLDRARIGSQTAVVVRYGDHC